MLFKVLALSLAATGVAAIATGFVWMRRNRSSSKQPETRRSPAESTPRASPIHDSPQTARLADAIDGNASQNARERTASPSRDTRSSDNDRARAARPLAAPADSDARSILDTVEPDSLNLAEPEDDLGRDSYPIDVDALGANWLARATQTSPQPARSEIDRVELEQDPFPTLDMDELTEPVDPQGPDSEQLRAGEANERRGPDSVGRS